MITVPLYPPLVACGNKLRFKHFDEKYCADLHDPGSERPPELVAVKAHQVGRDPEAGLALVCDAAPASIVIRVILETHVTQVQDRSDGGVHRHSISLRHTDVAEVSVEALEVVVVIQHLVLQSPLLFVLLRQSVTGDNFLSLRAQEILGTSAQVTEIVRRSKPQLLSINIEYKIGIRILNQSHAYLIFSEAPAHN